MTRRAYRLRPSRAVMVAIESGDSPLFSQREWTAGLPAAHMLKDGAVFLCLPKHEPCPVRCEVESVPIPEWARTTGEPEGAA